MIKVTVDDNRSSCQKLVGVGWWWRGCDCRTWTVPDNSWGLSRTFIGSSLLLTVTGFSKWQFECQLHFPPFPWAMAASKLYLIILTTDYRISIMQFYHIPVADLHRKKSHILVCNIYILNFERQESSISFLHLAAFPARNGYRGYLDLVVMIVVHPAIFGQLASAFPYLVLFITFSVFIIIGLVY